MQKRPENEIDVIAHGFMDSRAKLLDIAAFLDRVERAGQPSDYRVDALREAFKLLEEPGAQRVRCILESFSDPSEEPIPVALAKGASGAYAGGVS